MHKATAAGMTLAITSALAFGTSGTLVKPMLEGGWSPATIVIVRALLGGLILLLPTLIALRGRWSAVWTARWRIVGMGLVGVAGTQYLYFASLQSIPVSTALLIEYLAPVLLVAVAWVISRRRPAPAVLVGVCLAVGGLVLVIGPGALVPPDLLGTLYAFGATVGCAIYFVVAARDARGLPPIALACLGLLLGAVALLAVAALRLFPVTVSFADVAMFGGQLPWWMPVALIAAIPTAFAYFSGITGAQLVGSRIASFLGLLEVVFASVLAWLVLGEALTALQLIGGAVLIAGIVAVRSGGRDLPVSVAHEGAEGRPSTVAVS